MIYVAPSVSRGVGGERHEGVSSRGSRMRHCNQFNEVRDLTPLQSLHGDGGCVGRSNGIPRASINATRNIALNPLGSLGVLCR